MIDTNSGTPPSTSAATAQTTRRRHTIRTPAAAVLVALCLAAGLGAVLRADDVYFNRDLYAPNTLRGSEFARFATILLTGGSWWNTLPVAHSDGNGFYVTNEYVGAFASWASSPSAAKLAGQFDRGEGIDVALVGDPTWNSIPIAHQSDLGQFTVTNGYVGDFASWAADPAADKIVADFNGDGLSDIALTGPANWSTVPVAFSVGDGSFNIQNRATRCWPGTECIAHFAAWSSCPQVTRIIADFNADGLDDIALVGCAGWNTLPVAFSKGDGTFVVTNAPVDGAFATLASQSNVTKVVGRFMSGRMGIALLGHAGWTTVPVATTNCPAAYIGSACYDGTFTVSTAPMWPFAVWAAEPNVHLLSGDFNGDGVTDIAIVGGAASGAGSGVPIAFGTGNAAAFTVTDHLISGDFATLSNTPGVTPMVADLNGDGRSDIALFGGSNWNVIPVAYSNGDGTFRYVKNPVGAFASWATAPNVVRLAGIFRVFER